MAARKVAGHIPRSVARSLLQHGARGTKKVVVVFKRGIPSRVFGFDEHQKMVALPKHVRPWQHRKDRSAIPEPLGGVDGEVLGSLSRDEIYE